MKIKEIIEKLKKEKVDGYQLTKRFGILTSTWLLYYQNNLYFYFDINTDIEFNEENGYTEEEILELLDGDYFEIDMTIV